MPVINANSVDPDQTPRSAASDLGLHCLPMSRLRDAGHKWVNGKQYAPGGSKCFSYSINALFGSELMCRNVHRLAPVSSD